MSCVVPNCRSKFSNEKLSMHLFPDPMRDPKRHLTWIKLVNAEKLLKFDPFVVFKRYRICRNHFTKECFNGECKKLLQTANPSLYLGNGSKLKTKAFIDYEEKLLNMLKKNSINIEDDSFRLINLDYTSEDEIITDEPNINKDENEVEEEFLLMEVENCDDNQSQFTIVMPPSTENLKAPKIPKVLNYNRKSCLASGLNDRSASVELNKTRLRQFQENFKRNPKNLLTQNLCDKMSIFEASQLAEIHTEFSYKIDLRIAETIDKIHWSFAPFSILSVPFIKKYNLATFEFSQLHFVYHDKIERCFQFLSNLSDILVSSSSSDENVTASIISDSLDDTGRWNIFTNVIEKYGLVPKEVFTAKNSKAKIRNLNEILKSKLREYTDVLIDAASKNLNVNQLVDSQINEASDIVGIILGIPPEKFSFEHKNGDNKLFTIVSATPLEFYEQYIKPLSNASDKCCLINDPRSCLEYNSLYSLDDLNHSVIGSKIVYNNQPIDVLIDTTSKSIFNGEPVLAICALNGLDSFKLRNFSLLCDVKIGSSLNKSRRIELKDFSKKSAMIITAVLNDANGKPDKFLFEHFADGSKECIVIPKEYLQEIVLKVVISKKYLSNDVKSLYDYAPNILGPNDPLSNLLFM